MTSKLTRGDRDEIRKTLQEAADAEIAKIAANHPDWEEEVQEKARKLAIGSLGIGRELTEVEKLDKQIAELQDKRDKAEERAVAKLPKDKPRHKTVCPVPMSVCEAINNRQEKTTPKAMESHVAGKKITKVKADLNVKLQKLHACGTREEVASKGILK